MIDRNTPWRTIGDVPYAIWQATIEAAGGPDELASSLAYEQAKPHSALCLAMLKQESSYGTDFDQNPASNFNPLNLKLPLGGGYVKYPGWATGVRGWRMRITDPNYKDGIYANTISIADLINVFAPPNDQVHTTTDDYIDTIVGLMNGWRSEANTPARVPEGETQDMPITFGLVPKPQIIEMIVKKTAPGYGYDVCPPRHNVAGVAHETQGDPPGEGVVELRWYQQFFSCPNGERCGNGGSIDGALVDFCIARDGTIAMFNDPFGTRAGYANGAGTPASGTDGKKWIAHFGSAARNTKMWSCEFIKADNARLTQAQIVSGGKLFAWMSDLDQQPWTNYPYVAKYDGLRSIFNHNEVANTSCQQHPDDFAALVAAVKGVLKQYQGGSGTTPAPTPAPDIFPGVDLAIAKRLFGMVNGEDNKTYQFDPDGPVSKLWLSRAKQTGAWPPLATVWTYEDGRRYFRFADGSLILARPNVDPVWVKAA